MSKSKRPKQHRNTETPMVKRHRYYCFEHGGKFQVGYFYGGSTFQHTQTFETIEQRADWVRDNLSKFVAFNQGGT